jgi:hypothetical protein
MAECDLVHLDPDIGLQIPSVAPSAWLSPQYAFYEDLAPLVAAKKSVVCYQHLNRSRPGHAQAEMRAAELRHSLGVERIRCLWYHRGTARLYFILPAEAHAETLERRIDALLRSDWRRHFERVAV